LEHDHIGAVLRHDLVHDGLEQELERIIIHAILERHIDRVELAGAHTHIRDIPGARKKVVAVLVE
jgi:hypothetical protein